MVSAFPSRGRDGSIAITALNCDGHADNRGRSMIFNDIGAGQGCRMSITTLVAAASARREPSLPLPGDVGGGGDNRNSTR